MSSAKKLKQSSPMTTVQLPSQPLPPPVVVATSTSSPSSSSSFPSSSTSDQVQSAVIRYLQKRRYAPSMTEAYAKISKGKVQVQSKSQFATRELLRSEASSVACLALSAPPNVDPLITEQQYAKFKVWISESLDSYKPELAQLLYPMFTHLYLDLILSDHKLIAQKFHKRHQSTFMGNPSFASFIRILSTVMGPEDVQRDEAVTSFLASKYSVTLSNKTFHYLMRYLQQQQAQGQPPILLHILHAKVDVRLLDALGAPSSKTEAVQRVLSELTASSPSSPLKSVIKQEDEVNGYALSSESSSKVLEVIKAVREGPSPLPSTTLYRLSNQYSNIVCGSISAEANLLVTGCEDSSLISWDLVPPHPQDAEDEEEAPIDPDRDPAAIRLGCDDPEDSNHRMIAEKRVIFRGHSGPVYGATFMARAPYVLSVSEDTTMRLFDLKSGLNRAVYQGHSYPIWSVDSDRVGVNVVTGSMDRTAKLWHLEYTHPLRVYAGHEQDVDVVKFHPNCNYIATAGSDKTIRLWSHSDANMVRVFNGHRGSILSMAFSPNGKLLASAGEDRRVKVWDLASSVMLKELRGHNETVHCLAWSGDSNLLASAGMDGVIKLWDVASDKSETSIPTNSSGRYGTTNIIGLCYSPHNTLIATGVSQNSSFLRSTKLATTSTTTIS